MRTNGNTRRVHFNSPERLVERVDAIASLLQKDRTELINEALREHVRATADRDAFQQLVANEYYEDRLDFDTVKQLVDTEAALRLRLLKSDLEGEPLDLSPPDDTEVYGGDRRTVGPADPSE